MSMRKTQFYKKEIDYYYDVCIIGGGVMGCSVAYFLASTIYKGFKICVIEKDTSVEYSMRSLRCFFPSFILLPESLESLNSRSQSSRTKFSLNKEIEVYSLQHGISPKIGETFIGCS